MLNHQELFGRVDVAPHCSVRIREHRGIRLTAWCNRLRRCLSATPATGPHHAGTSASRDFHQVLSSRWLRGDRQPHRSGCVGMV